MGHGRIKNQKRTEWGQIVEFFEEKLEEIPGLGERGSDSDTAGWRRRIFGRWRNGGSHDVRDWSGRQRSWGYGSRRRHGGGTRRRNWVLGMKRSWWWNNLRDRSRTTAGNGRWRTSGMKLVKEGGWRYWHLDDCSDIFFIFRQKSWVITMMVSLSLLQKVYQVGVCLKCAARLAILLT